MYTPEQIGVGTGLIASAAVVASLSILGFDNSVIRLLAWSPDQRRLVSSVLIVVSAASFGASLIYIAGLPIFAPLLASQLSRPLPFVAFVTSCIVVSISGVIDAVFIAQRSSHYVLAKNTLLSITKIIAAAALVSMGPMGVFGSVSLATIVAVAFAFMMLPRAVQGGTGWHFSVGILRSARRSSAYNYVTNVLNNLPLQGLPILVLNALGPRASAVYYLDMTIASVFYTASISVANALYAEVSHSSDHRDSQLTRALMMLVVMLTPGIVIVVAFGHKLLLLFGRQYAADGLGLLRWFTAASLFVALNNAAVPLLNLAYRLRTLAALSSAGALVLLAASWGGLAARPRLETVGLVWFAGQGALSVAYVAVVPEVRHVIAKAKLFTGRRRKD